MKRNEKHIQWVLSFHTRYCRQNEQQTSDVTFDLCKQHLDGWGSQDSPAGRNILTFTGQRWALTTRCLAAHPAHIKDLSIYQTHTHSHAHTHTHTRRRGHLQQLWVTDGGGWPSYTGPHTHTYIYMHNLISTYTYVDFMDELTHTHAHTL